MDVGVGLWAMRSTAERPVPHARLYAELRQAARWAEELGFHSLWVTEHHFWHDGWCPSPLVALATLAPLTTRLRLGTCVALLPLHDPGRFAAQARALWGLCGGRLELGVGMGHRDAEFDGFGLERRRRRELFERGLAALAGPGPRVWVGGMARAAVERAARSGLGLLLPQTLRPPEAAERARWYREAGGPGPVGVLRDVWVSRDPGAARAEAEAALRRHYREEAGAWWVLSEGGVRDLGFRLPRALGRQLERALGCAVVGTAADVGEALGALGFADLVILRVCYDGTPPERVRESLELLAGVQPP